MSSLNKAQENFWFWRFKLTYYANISIDIEVLLCIWIKAGQL